MPATLTSGGSVSRSIQEVTKTRDAQISLHGPARLTISGQQVRVQRKGLALLYYLAIEGPISRARAAQLLWGHQNALSNLRTELHRLKSELEPYGLTLIQEHSDPLRLAEVRLETSVNGVEVLEGLDDVSPEFQEWLESQRAGKRTVKTRNPRNALLEELKRGLRLPAVLVLSSEPGGGRLELATSLARSLGLELKKDLDGEEPAAHYLLPEQVDVETLVELVRGTTRRLFVIEGSVFAEEPEVVRRLRSRLPAERVRDITLEPLQWWEAQELLPSDLPFERAAALYLASAGNLGYLRELLELKREGQPGRVSVPLRMRAAFELEARKLSPPAYAALRRASVHEGVLTPALVTALELEESLAELESAGWLLLDNRGWFFRSELARRLLLEQVPGGIRQRVTASLAPHAGERFKLHARYPGRHSPSRDQTRALTTQRKRSVGVGPELYPPDVRASGAGVKTRGTRLSWSRPGAYGKRAQAHISTEGSPVLLRLTGHARILCGDAQESASAAPGITVTVHAGGARHRQGVVELAGSPRGRGPDAETVVLPLGSSFDHWFLAPAASTLSLESSGSSATVVELELGAYLPTSPGSATEHGKRVVQAYSVSWCSFFGEVSEEHDLVAVNAPFTEAHPGG